MCLSCGQCISNFQRRSRWQGDRDTTSHKCLDIIAPITAATYGDCISEMPASLILPPNSSLQWAAQHLSLWLSQIFWDVLYHNRKNIHAPFWKTKQNKNIPHNLLFPSVKRARSTWSIEVYTNPFFCFNLYSCASFSKLVKTPWKAGSI